MSVSALDQLLLAIAGTRPPLAAAAKKRDPFAAHDLLLPTPFHRRGAPAPPTTADTKQQRKRQHSHIQKPSPQPQPALSLRLYGLKKNGWPRTLLAALRVDVDELSGPKRIASPASARGIAMDPSVRLFFDGLLLQATDEAASSSNTFPWRRVAPLPAGKKSRPLLQIAVDPAHQKPVVGIPVNREIEHVRSRRKSPRRMSSPTPRRARRGSSYHFEPRAAATTANETDDELTDESELYLDRVEAAIDAATASARRVVAAEANAQLSFELMERKANSNTHYAATHGAAWRLGDTHSVELHAPSLDESSLDADRSPSDPRSELEALRAENAEQKALIRQLLIENRRLLAQQEQQQQQQLNLERDLDVGSSVPSKRKRLINSSQEEDEDARRRGASSASTVSSATSSPISRRESLTFSVQDGYETFVDHKFDHLVSEITSELAELLSEDSFPTFATAACVR